MSIRTKLITAAQMCGRAEAGMRAYREMLSVANADSTAVGHAATYFRRLAVELERTAIELQQTNRRAADLGDDE
ncbi:hypothetical protein [Burkholderia sp. BCC1047]|uniref:hypothetical protein n=1 Tax=Burkholderia sp. BCC1047 TaxID=2676299 RepID=UPI00158DBC67|nr:hypothetical protein [Burkholderia sp. BCC1047]